MGRFRPPERPAETQPSTARTAIDAVVMTGLAALPDAWRAPVEDRLSFSADSVALPSAIGQLAVGALIWAAGLPPYVQSQLHAVAAAATRLPEGSRDEALIYGSYVVLGNPILTLQYTFTSVTGLLGALMVLGALVRGASIPGEWRNNADPTLGAVEWARRRLMRGVAARRRERQKGAPAPDVLTEADGSLGWHLRITSREDYPWHEGASVLVDGVHHRLVSRRETLVDGGRLRLVYELRRCEAADVIRGHASYAPTRPPRVRRAGA